LLEGGPGGGAGRFNEAPCRDGIGGKIPHGGGGFRDGGLGDDLNEISFRDLALLGGCGLLLGFGDIGGGGIFDEDLTLPVVVLGGGGGGAGFFPMEGDRDTAKLFAVFVGLGSLDGESAQITGIDEDTRVSSFRSSTTRSRSVRRDSKKFSIEIQPSCFKL
jgi:hypothetical protein